MFVPIKGFGFFLYTSDMDIPGKQKPGVIIFKSVGFGFRGEIES
jgi:hypothetical protein